MTSRALAFLLIGALGTGCPSSTPNTAKQPVPPGGPDVAFDIYDSGIHNFFYRRGPISAHLLASSGELPRLIVAFPAGNTGIGLWFEKTAKPVKLDVAGGLDGVERKDGMRGVAATIECDAEKLQLRDGVLGSIRTLRDFAAGRPKPPETEHETVAGTAVVPKRSVLLRRTMADGKHHAELLLEPEEGTTIDPNGGKLVITSTAGKPIRVRVTALQDDTPLTPLPSDQLLTITPPESAQPDLRVLAFLSYKEKLLAGSWHYLTYFGRDTMMTVRLLMPVLKPEVIEAALGGVIDRLAPDGDVAHEEDIGDFATLRHIKQGEHPADMQEPIFDYKMVDDDLMLAPVLAAYLATDAGKAHAAQFFARKTPLGETYAQALAHNLELVARKATAFAEKPVATNLVALKDGIPVGQWRDSETGIGNGRYAFDVNVALVPAALEASATLYESPLMGANATAAARARSLDEKWRAAEPLFDVTVPKVDAISRVDAYAKEQDIASPSAAITGDVKFHALSLDAQGKPIAVMHTDDGFVLLFGSPSPAFLDGVAKNLTTAFPAGLKTPVGIVVADGAYVTDPAVRNLFSRDHYHGAVVWSWQQALLAAGLERQLARTDLPAPTRANLENAQRELWAVIDHMATQRSGELWSWTVQNHQMVHQPYGAGGGADESNAAQLWSTVFLGVRKPAGMK